MSLFLNSTSIFLQKRMVIIFYDVDFAIRMCVSDFSIYHFVMILDLSNINNGLLKRIILGLYLFIHTDTLKNNP